MSGAIYFKGFLNDNNLYRYLALFDWDQPLFTNGIHDSNPVQSYVSSAPPYLVDGHWIWQADGTGYATVIESTGGYSTIYPVGTRATVDSLINAGWPPLGSYSSDNTTDPTGRSLYSTLYDFVYIDPTTTISIIADDPQPWTGSGLIASVVVSPYAINYTLTYNGSTTPPAEIGTYNVYAYITNYPSIHASKIVHIVPLQASVNIDIPNNYYFNGNEITPYITTSPTDISYDVKYNGRYQKPNKVGQWNVDVTITDPHYYGSGSESFFVYEDCSNGIVAYYTMDEESGERKDLTGTYPLEERNRPIPSSQGVTDKCVNFTNANQYLTTNDFPILKQFSVYCWIKVQPNSIPANGICFITKPSSVDFIFYIYADNEYIWGGIDNQAYQQPRIDFVADGAWHFVCLIFDQYEEGKITFYLDGTKIKGNTEGPIISANPLPLVVNDPIENYNGLFEIDEVGIFQIALSDEEVNDMLINQNRPVYSCNPQPPVPPTPPSPPYVPPTPPSPPYVPPTPPSPPYVPPTNPPSNQPICPWFYMQPSPYIGGDAQNAYRICADTREDLYAAVADFRVNTLLINAGYVQTDVDSFLWAQNVNSTSIPVSGWNYCQGNVRITGVTLEDLYRAVAAYRQDNAIDVGNWIYDVDTYLAGLVDAVGKRVRIRVCGC